MTFDFERYRQFVESFDLSEAQKLDVARSIYDAMGLIVAAEFDTSPATKTCGKAIHRAADNDDDLLQSSPSALKDIYNNSANGLRRRESP